MFERFSNFFKDLVDPVARVEFIPGDPRLSVAALLVHAVSVDGVVTGIEAEGLQQALRRLYGMEAREARHLIDAGRDRARGALDTTEFVGDLARKLTAAEKLAVVEALWDLACADGQLHEFEEDMLWRIAGPLGVPEADREAVRAKVMAAHGMSG